MKRSRDSNDDEEDSHAQKKGRNGTPIPFVQPSESNIGTGSADFVTSMHSSRNNKRGIDEMNEQLKLESDRPAKRLDRGHGITRARNFDDVMEDEDMTHSSRNNKRGIDEMNEQLKLESDRPAKRLDRGHGITRARNFDDVMEDEDMTHGSRNNKRGIDEMNEQLELESDYGSMSADSNDDGMRDEAIMHSPRNNKRGFEGMSGQTEPDLDRPAKRQDHGRGVTWVRNVDDVMQDEDMMHGSRNNKRSREEMRGQLDLKSDRPTKRLHHDYDMQDEDMTHGSRNNKRNIDEMNEQLELESERPARRLRHGHDSMSAGSDDDGMRDEAQPTQGLSDYISVYTGRVKLCYLLQRTDPGDENLCGILNEAYSSDSTTFATVVHDSPQDVRLWALERVDAKFRRTIIDLMSNIEREKESNDPIRALPTIMTDSLARKSSGGTRTCTVCGDGFCSANEKNPADVEDVVWKDCRNHVMHLECFSRKVFKGEMPLQGICGCLGKV